MQTIMTDFVLVKVKGLSADIMCKVMPHFKEQLTTEGNSEILYTRLHKALHGCMQSALLSYRTFLKKNYKEWDLFQTGMMPVLPIKR